MKLKFTWLAAGLTTLAAAACGGDQDPASGDGDGTGATGTGASASGAAPGTGGSGGTPSGGNPGDGDGDTGGTPGDGDMGDGDTGATPGDGDGDMGGMGGELGDGDGVVIGTTDCDITLLGEDVSDVIPSVGIIEFSTDLPSLTQATIEFGKTTSYGMEAPVDLSETDYRTLLLGMTFDSTYHYRIVLENASDTCVSTDQEIITGSRPTGAPADATVTTGTTGTPVPGFMVAGSSSGGWVQIFNHLGELVWTFKTSVGTASSPRMARDGKSLLVANVNVPTTNSNGSAVEVSMDGSTEVALSIDQHAHHDLAPTDDGGFYYIVRNVSGPCDAIYKYPGNTLFYDLKDAFPNSGLSGTGDECHANKIHLNPDDDSLTVSLMELSAFATVGTNGTLKWVLGSSDSTFDLGSYTWTRNFGFHWADATTFAFFENGSGGGQSKGHVLTLDFTNDEVDADVSYTLAGSSMVYGDAQVLPSGNLLFTASNSNRVEEMTPQGDIVQSLQLTSGSGGIGNASIGQLTFRETLYGPPPR